MKALSVIFVLLIVAVHLTVESSVNFTLHDDNHADWPTAKFRCEALGQTLAVLDTEEKRSEMREQEISLSGSPWIGFHDPDENDMFVWLNGNPLPNDDENRKDGNPDLGEQYCGYVTSSFKLADYDCTETGPYICETQGKQAYPWDNKAIKQGRYLQRYSQSCRLLSYRHTGGRNDPQRPFPH